MNNKEENKKRNPNILRRMSVKFFTEMDLIDSKRKEFGFDPLSLPEKTELITRHNSWWRIKEDLIHFNRKVLDNGGIPNVEQ